MRLQYQLSNCRLRPTDVRQALTQNVHIVQFEGERYVYKFMIRSSNQGTFEKEFQHYVQVQECDGVPDLATVVERQGRIRGLLLHRWPEPSRRNFRSR